MKSESLKLFGLKTTKGYWWEAPLSISEISAFGNSKKVTPILPICILTMPFWVSSKSETKKKIFSKGHLWRFSDFQSLDFLKNIKGSPLWKKKFFLSPILMKFKIWNPYGLGISHMKFEQNRWQKIFWHRRVPPLDFSRKFWKKFFCLRFGSNFMCKIPRP